MEIRENIMNTIKEDLHNRLIERNVADQNRSSLIETEEHMRKTLISIHL